MKTETEIIKKIKGELGEYKKATLGSPDKVIFRRKEYSHILPKEMQEKNLINSAVMPKFNEVARHSLFNHLTSSQALCLNLFGPLVADHLNLLNPLFNVDLKDCVRSKFEFIDELINDGTNFDFFIETNKHERLYFEVKYTESTIHTTCGAKDPESRWRNIYCKLMESILKDKNSISQDVFCKRYQLWRNICRVANHHCEVYFVFPAFREKLKRQVEAARQSLKPEFRNKVHVLTVDEICNTLMECGENKFIEHYEEFKKKYLPEKIYNED